MVGRSPPGAPPRRPETRGRDRGFGRPRTPAARRHREDDRAAEIGRPAPHLTPSSDTIGWRPPPRSRTEARHRRQDQCSGGLTTRGPLQKRFFKRLLAGLKYRPRRLITDGLKSYGAARRG